MLINRIAHHAHTDRIARRARIDHTIALVITSAHIRTIGRIIWRMATWRIGRRGMQQVIAPTPRAVHITPERSTLQRGIIEATRRRDIMPLVITAPGATQSNTRSANTRCTIGRSTTLPGIARQRGIARGRRPSITRVIIAASIGHISGAAHIIGRTIPAIITAHIIEGGSGE